MFWINCKAYAGTELYLYFTDLDWCFDALYETVRQDFQIFVRMGRLDQEHELVTACAAREISLRQAGAHTVCASAQHIVTDVMPVKIIYGFELIEIKTQQGETLSLIHI